MQRKEPASPPTMRVFALPAQYSYQDVQRGWKHEEASESVRGAAARNMQETDVETSDMGMR